MFGVETTTTSQRPLSNSSRCPEKTFKTLKVKNNFTEEIFKVKHKYKSPIAQNGSISTQGLPQDIEKQLHNFHDRILGIRNLSILISIKINNGYKLQSQISYAHNWPKLFELLPISALKRTKQHLIPKLQRRTVTYC